MKKYTIEDLDQLTRKSMTSREPPDILEEPHEFVTKNRQDVLFGVYSAKDWFFSDFLRKRFLSGEATIQEDVDWLVPSTFKLTQFVGTHFQVFTFTNAEQVVITLDKALVKLDHQRGKLTGEIVGAPQVVKETLAFFDSTFKRAENLIEWVYDTRGNTISVPLNYRPAISAAYPWLNEGLNPFFDSYLNSDACILILLGPPGTGKTTFIKNLIHRSGGDAKVAYDANVINSDGFFAGFIEDDTNFLIMEDSDNFLKSRADGNTMMHKFLNVSDGLISAADKKLVFSTNLPSIHDIDSALTREGRCFGILEFRPLTVPEAEAVIKEAGHGAVPAGMDKVTLAEIFSVQTYKGEQSNRKVGFY